MNEIKKLTEQLIAEFEKIGWGTKPEKPYALEDMQLKFWEGGRIEWSQLIGVDEGFRELIVTDKERFI